MTRPWLDFTAERPTTFEEIEREAPRFRTLMERARDRVKASRIASAARSGKPTDVEVSAHLAAILERAERTGAR